MAQPLPDEAQALLEQSTQRFAGKPLHVVSATVEVLPPSRDAVHDLIAKFTLDTVGAIDRAETNPETLGTAVEAVMTLFGDTGVFDAYDRSSARGQVYDIVLEMAEQLRRDIAAQTQHRMRTFAGVHLIPQLTVKEGVSK